jgi:crotonobetainyl-CoA hydratase
MSAYPTTGPIKCIVEGAIIEVVLDRPKANAIDLATSRIMGDIFAKFRDDPELRVAIISSAHEKFFCPGWDLKAAAAGDEVDGDYGVGGFAGLQELRELNKPVIAAIHGICCGGGFEYALSADMILASDDATFALPEIRSGTVADAASVKLPKRIPYHIAMELLLTGRWFDAKEANQWGIVNHVYQRDQLNAEAWKLARTLASGPPLVYAAIKQIIRDAEDSKFQDAMNRITQRQLKTVDVLYGSDDNKEGAIAFTEKRDPVWKGK